MGIKRGIIIYFTIGRWAGMGGRRRYYVVCNFFAAGGLKL